MAQILVVEDHEMSRDMLPRRLLRCGYAVAIAVEGEQGMALAQSEAPVLILMDMRLPLLDGWEATRRLKAAGDPCSGSAWDVCRRSVTLAHMEDPP